MAVMLSTPNPQASSRPTPPHPLQRDLLNAPDCLTFDRITRLAVHALRKPFAAISLTDATCQWLRSRVGPIPLMIPSYDAPCTRVAETRKPLAVPDLLAHPAYRTGLLAAHGVRFYAGVPLLLPDGEVLGAFCIMGPEIHAATPAEMGLLHDTAALVMSQIELRHAGGRIDRLSGLPNRSQFFHEIEDLARRQPSRPRLIALLDLARPDEWAHMLRAVGSACLDDLVRLDAARLRAAIPAGCRLYHVGPTEFVLLAPPGTDQDSFVSLLENDLLRCAIGSNALFSTTCTAGLALVTPGEAPPADLLRRVHAALDDARARHAPLGIYAPAQDGAYRRAFTLLNDFEHALTETALTGQAGLRLVYQPRLELATGRCLGVEALLRWKHPFLGEIGPNEFVPLVEKTTMARPMMRWVLANALAQLHLWRNAGLLLQLSVNVSPANLDEPDFAEHVVQTLEATGLPPSALELEITESALLDDHSPAMQQLRAISDAGIRIAIDDFGTGYSSLSYLQRLPADVVKIDQSFIRGLTQDGEDESRRRTLVTAMIALSHDLGYRVVAEGIETQAAADMLASLDCDEVQGFHFARPMPPAAFLSWHAQRTWTTYPREPETTPPHPIPLQSVETRTHATLI